MAARTIPTPSLSPTDSRQPLSRFHGVRPPSLTGTTANSELQEPLITADFSPMSTATLHPGDCRQLLSQIPSGTAKLVVTSPPYNVGKAYEKRQTIDEYLATQDSVIKEAVRIVGPNGSVCWQVGNHVSSGEVYPLDILLYPLFKKHGLYLRNRIVWTFGHGLHCSQRFSGRHETILWFTKSDSYTFNLDAVRVPSKYPGKKHFKGPKRGQLSGNPLGKNPTDVWDIPNVKFNHVEKTAHPCQFPVELVERLLLALTNPDDLVVDPFMGVGSTIVAAALHGRRGAGADIVPKYVSIARDRVRLALRGELRTRPMGRPVYVPFASASRSSGSHSARVLSR